MGILYIRDKNRNLTPVPALKGAGGNGTFETLTLKENECIGAANNPLELILLSGRAVFDVDADAPDASAIDITTGVMLGAEDLYATYVQGHVALLVRPDVIWVKAVSSEGISLLARGSYKIFTAE